MGGYKDVDGHLSFVSDDDPEDDIRRDIFNLREERVFFRARILELEAQLATVRADAFYEAREIVLDAENNGDIGYIADILEESSKAKEVK